MATRRISQRRTLKLIPLRRFEDVCLVVSQDQIDCAAVTHRYWTAQIEIEVIGLDPGHGSPTELPSLRSNLIGNWVAL